MNARPWTAAVALALLAAGVAQAAVHVTFSTPSSAALSAATPVVLAGGGDGTTTLGVNATRATTTVQLPGAPRTFAQLLSVRSASDAPVLSRVRFVEATNLDRVNAATVTLGAIAQVVIANGVVAQAQGALTPLPARGELPAGATLHVHAGRPMTLVLAIETQPAGAPGVVLSETWILETI